jgi:uncharacterized membrane protein
LGLLGGIIMLVGGGTNRAVKWAAAQSITFWGGLFGLIFLALSIIGLIVWLWTSISAFQGKEVEIPVVGGLARQLFASQLGGA